MLGSIRRVSNRMSAGLNQSYIFESAYKVDMDFVHSNIVNNMEARVCCCMCMSSHMTYLCARFPS